MPGVVKRRTRNSSGGGPPLQHQLITSQAVSVDVTLPASKRSRKSMDMDPDLENVLADKSLLVECLTKAGMVVKVKEEQNVLKEDQAIFLKKFNKDISTALDYPDNIENMFSTLSNWLEDEAFLIKCLTSTLTSISCNSARSSQQDSILRLLLNTNDLQPKLLGLLLEKLAEISLMQEGQEMMNTQQGNIPRLILSAVRWLDKIVSGDGLADKMVEILDATSRYQQVEVISALPEIIPDQQHATIALHLQKMLGERQPLISSILDCFSNLNLKPDLVTELQTSVLKKVPSCGMSDLPTVVEFLLSSCTKYDCSMLVQDLRDSLDLTVKIRPSQRPGPGSPKKRMLEKNKSVECIILDKISMAMSTDKWMGDAWLSAVESVRDVSEVKPLDLLLLLLLHKNQQRRKTVESIIRNKIRAGLFTEELVSSTFQKHIAPLKQHMMSVLALAEALLECSEDIVVSFAREIYSSAFSKLGAFCQQEVVGDLVAKVGAGGGGIITRGAINVLDELSEHHSELLAKYGLFVTAILDHMEGMELWQVRKVMNILARLAWRVGGEDAGGVIQDDLRIVVKKQIDSSHVVLKRMGVVGAVVSVKAMVVAHTGGGDEMGEPVAESSRNTSVVLEGLLGEAMELLEFVKMRTRNWPDVAGLFLDELSNMVAEDTIIDSKFMEQVSVKFAEDFQTEYIEDANATENNEFTVKSTFEKMLDEDAEDSDGAPISLSLAPQVMKMMGVPSKAGPVIPVRGEQLTLVARLIPTFRLLSKSVMAKCKGDLEEIDAVLGCGVWIFPKDVINNIRDLSVVEKNAICATLFYATNWFIELVNSFSTQQEEDIKVKVLLRIKQVLEMQKTIATALKQNPSFKPPTALFSEDISWWSPPQGQEGKKGKKAGKGKKGGKGKKFKAGEPDTMMMNATLHLNTQRSQAQASQPQSNTVLMEGNNDSQEVMDLKYYRPFFRELDLSTLAVLTFMPTTTSSEPSLEEEFAEPKFRPPELLYLLRDLQAKLDKSLISTGKKRGIPGKTNPLSTVGFTNMCLISPDKVVEKVSPYLKHIFTHLDEISSYFQRLVSLHDGVMDSVDMFTAQSIIFSKCIKAGFQVVNTFFSWSGFQSSTCSFILKTSLYHLVCRVSDLSSTSNLSTLITTSIKYLKTFSSTVLTVDVAASHLLLISTLAKLGDTEDQAKSRETVAKVAEEYLARDWRSATGEKEKGAEFNSQVEKILMVLLSSSKHVVEVMEQMCKEGVTPVIASKEGTSDTFPVVTRATLGVVYKVMMATLVGEVKKLTYGVTKDPEAQFSIWSKAVETLVVMTTSLKMWCNRSLLASVLKHCRHFIDHFVRHGMPLVERLFRRKRTGCVDLIKNLQMATRFLQTVCSHSKISQDVSLANNVPLLKKSLEVLVFRVKAMLAANDCLDAFVLGNLKNRDLQGEEILSQASIEEEDEGEEEGEEEEAGESDVDLGGEEESEEHELAEGDSAMSIEV